MSGAAGEPAWLRDRRLAAWEAFVRLPLPSANDEEWRRTDIGALDLDAFGVLPHRVQKGRAPAPLGALVGDPAGAAGLRLVVNGAQIEERPARDLAQRGLIFTSLSEAVAAHPDLVRRYLGSVVRDDENKFRAHHGALWSGGTFLYVPKGLEVDVQLVTGTWLDREGAAFLPHTLVVAEERSRVTLVEGFGDGPQQFDYHTLQEHAAPSTTSDLLYKGVLKDKARSVFSGLIRADYGAQKTNAFQLNRNLILSEGARADSMPKLEIMANDLRCTHGASTSRLNDDQIFYLMSRGLPRAVAVRMMVDGFLSEIFDRIPLEMVRRRLSETVERKMEDYV